MKVYYNFLLVKVTHPPTLPKGIWKSIAETINRLFDYLIGMMFFDSTRLFIITVVSCGLVDEASQQIQNCEKVACSH